MNDSLRVLVAGFLNSPHVNAWVEAVAASGNEVHLTGRDAPQLPPSVQAANIYRLPATGPPLLRSLSMSRSLAVVAADVAPDLIHAHWLPEFGWMAAREGIGPLVCSAWGSDVFRMSAIGRRRSKRALDAAELVMADSLDLARATRELAGRDVPVEVVRWGLDLDRFAPGDIAAAREVFELEQDGPLIVSVRGFDPVYNPQLLLEAFAHVRTRRHDARLLLKYAAESVPRTVAAAIERMRLDDAVTLLGNVPPERMPDVYRAADVVVSVPSSDSSPRSVWEALACGRPVVVSDLPWAREELEDGRHAVLASLEPEAVAAEIGRVLEDEGFARRLGAEGRALALAEVDPQTCTARIEMLYREVARTTS